MRTFLAILVVAASLRGQNPETLHLANVNLQFTPKLNLQLHSRYRAQELGTSFFQLRGGPILTYNVQPKLTLIGGYYRLDQRNQSTHTDMLFNRYFTGASATVWSNAAVALDTRVLYERFVGVPAGDYNRYRNRWQITSRRKGWQPVATFEVLRGQDVTRFRTGAFLQKQVNPGFLFGVGYEMRQNVSGTYSHIVTTNVTFTKRLFFSPKN